jgi:Gram-negative bacterial TonB protein C-terminal
MLLSRSTIFVLANVALVMSASTDNIAVSPDVVGRRQATAATDEKDWRTVNCRVTLPSDGRFDPPPSAVSGFHLRPEGPWYGFWFGTEKLWTLPPIDGIWRGRVPTKPNEYVFTNKLPWFRVHPGFSNKGSLTITGKRLDGPAPSFTEALGTNVDIFRADGHPMIMGGVSIPVFGCWEITGRYKDQELSFTVWVAPLPSWTDRATNFNPPPLWPPEDPNRIVQRVQVAGEVEAKRLAYRVIPEIPPEAEDANVSGTVVLHAIIGTAGRPRQLEYVSGPRLLTQAAIDAVKWWEYAVTSTGDNPVEVETAVEVTFPKPRN